MTRVWMRRAYVLRPSSISDSASAKLSERNAINSDCRRTDICELITLTSAVRAGEGNVWSAARIVLLLSQCDGRLQSRRTPRGRGTRQQRHAQQNRTDTN